MKDSSLFKLQSISLISRIMAMFLGIVQSVFIVKTISQTGWGTIQVIASIASIVGASQAFGLTSGSTREIAGAKTNSEAFKIFITSLIFRICISLPFAIYLFVFAPALAQSNSDSIDVVWALRIISFVLLLQASQGIFNSVISGFRKFKTLFTYQVVIAFISVLLYIPLVYLYQFKGYYYAYFLFNFIGFVVLLVLAIQNFEKPFPKILFIDSKKILKEIFGISLVIYLVKLIYTFWQQSPVLYLKYILNIPESSIAIFSLAMFYSTKLMVFSDSITDVTLPVMSKKFIDDIEDFKISYKKNYIKTFLIITFVSSIAVYWSREVMLIITSGRPDYIPSVTLIPFTLLGIWSYSQINLLKSSVYVPSKKLIGLFITYISMVIFVYIVLYLLNILNLEILFKLSIAFGVGSFIAYLVSIYIIYKQLKLSLLTKLLVYYLGISILFSSLFFYSNNILMKLIFTLLYLTMSYYFFEKIKLITFIKNKFLKLI
ncbi:hypothetical protein COV24_01985 [candidate division WWE3 bacterium CG10_big_fil_rev_8_21_14_0_10_32_10]|uniref:Polysaccharide biosynthesis protein C-terminal domain-containing protein n=1 Tax=candidate division WWE3 bacterium CG10_big_fil_rev_8_21_14_0_10_32_10 TaxID=1975090 RepID=A0A2H0RAL4_UNCKA|nr:MAG: hypothetical protein COV24_01985 [candidate division WWE3 bacterium CG10_big_fil_rev_8_21_14_0_10_32_10]